MLLAKQHGLIDSAAQVLHDLRSMNFRLGDKTICEALERAVEEYGKQENDSYIIRILSKSPSALVVTRREFYELVLFIQPAILIPLINVHDIDQLFSLDS